MNESNANPWRDAEDEETRRVQGLIAERDARRDPNLPGAISAMAEAVANGGPLAAPPAATDPGAMPAARAALRDAIEKRAASQAAVSGAESALAKGGELLRTAEEDLRKLGDPERDIAAWRADRVRAAVNGGAPAVMAVPKPLAARLDSLLVARQHVEAHRAVCSELKKELDDAQAMHDAADRLVSVRAQAVLQARAEALAYHLSVAIGRVCALYDSLHAASCTWVVRDGKMGPIGLPPSALGGMQMAEPLAGDVRRRRVAAMRTPGKIPDQAAADWRDAYEKLRADADAELP
jgi:hypothetical protein